MLFQAVKIDRLQRLLAIYAISVSKELMKSFSSARKSSPIVTILKTRTIRQKSRVCLHGLSDWLVVAEEVPSNVLRFYQEVEELTRGNL